jgi:hypothetical protein
MYHAKCTVYSIVNPKPEARNPNEERISTESHFSDFRSSDFGFRISFIRHC